MSYRFIQHSATSCMGPIFINCFVEPKPVNLINKTTSKGFRTLVTSSFFFLFLFWLNSSNVHLDVL